MSNLAERDHSDLHISSLNKTLGLDTLSPNQQVATIHAQAYDFTRMPGQTQALAEELANFAAAKIEAPVLVRIEALERALAFNYAYETIRDIALEYPHIDEAVNGYEVESTNPYQDRRTISRYLTHQLALADGIDNDDAIYNPEIDMGKLDCHFDEIPMRSYFFLDSLRNDPTRTELYNKFKDLDQTVQDVIADRLGLIRRSLTFRNWLSAARAAELIGHGEEYRQVLNHILGNDHPGALESIDLISGMHSSGGVQRAFPESFKEGAQIGLRHLLADALFAVSHHYQNGAQTAIRLPLNQEESVLPLVLSGDEPVELLDGLRNVLNALPNATYLLGKTVKVSDLDGAAIYRIISNYDRPQVSLYVRPYGGSNYQRDLEYGRLGEGVEASISYVVDPTLKSDAMIEVGKHKSKDVDNRVSIRLDREGISRLSRNTGVKRDPTRQEGTLSLDVGSIIGKDEWFSTKLGRFLAFGNLLRTRSQNQETHLNHVTEYFNDQDGDADSFATAAVELVGVMEAARMTQTDIVEHFSGKIALAQL